MEIILLRHAKTPKLEEAGVKTDADRPLGGLGRQQARAAGRALEALELLPELVLASPILRARDTAELAVEGMGGGVDLRLHPPLSTSGQAEPLWDSLREFSSAKRLLLVGHQPTLGELASLLLVGTTQVMMELKPGGMLLVEMDSVHGAGALRWLLTPQQIEALA